MPWSAETMISIAAVVVGLVTYVGAKRREMRIRRAELVRTYTSEFYADPKVTDLFMTIDYDRLEFDDLIGSPNELALIQLLDYFNAMGHNWKRGVLKLDDIFPTTLAYAALRTWENHAVRQYLKQIRKWDEERYAPGSGFRYFEELAIEIAFICRRVPADRGVGGQMLSAPVRRPAAMVVYTRSSAARRCRKLAARISARMSRTSHRLDPSTDRQDNE